MRRAGSWDPLLQCLHLDSSSNKIQRNYMGLKITACLPTGGANSGQKIQRDQKTQLTILKSPEQKRGVGSKSRVLSMPPAQNITSGVGRPPKPPLQPDTLDTPLPSPHIRRELPPPPALGSKPARDRDVCSLYPLLQQVPQ